MMATKSDLENLIAKLRGEIFTLNEAIDKAKTGERLAKQDADRNERNWQACERRLQAVRQSIETALVVNHNSSVAPSGDWFKGQLIEDGINESIRLLRHLHGLTKDDVPF